MRETKGARRFQRRLAARRAAALASESTPASSDVLDLDARLRRALGNRPPRQR